jgi:hypothetical protein
MRSSTIHLWMLWGQAYGTQNIDLGKFLCGYKVSRLSVSIATPAFPDIMLDASLPRLLFTCSLLCALTGLTACGGGAEPASSATVPAYAAAAVQMPVADCESQACQGLRIIDSNAETFRADAARRDALAMAVIQAGDHPAPGN